MNLLSLSGGIVSVFLFALCLFFVFLCRYAKTGYLLTHKKEEQEKKPDKNVEPVYYIVERKKRTQKREYENPKQIEFK